MTHGLYPFVFQVRIARRADSGDHEPDPVGTYQRVLVMCVSRGGADMAVGLLYLIVQPGAVVVAGHCARVSRGNRYFSPLSFEW